MRFTHPIPSKPFYPDFRILRTCLKTATLRYFAAVSAFEIGPGFSPNIEDRNHSGLQPLRYVSLPLSTQFEFSKKAPVKPMPGISSLPFFNSGKRRNSGPVA
ncbi:hypothetical protein HDF08_002098 [Edaphobacter lichenicola]|uniref:Uncharacterized protein n=1 Tax=Tunturiibacter lichenicola TaxID=2051959 RepID=A0A852VFK9_9BACT|nr:hypothetical protein [Edaphobacter lichenicola]